MPLLGSFVTYLPHVWLDLSCYARLDLDTCSDTHSLQRGTPLLAPEGSLFDPTLALVGLRLS